MSKIKENKRTNILICGAYGEGNMGDESILIELARLLKEAFPEAQLSVITKKPEAAADLSLEGVNGKNLPRVRAAIEKADAMVAAGGVMVENMLLHKSLEDHIMLLELARQKKTAVFFHSFSISPLLRSREREKLNTALVNIANFISLRDRESYEWIKKSGYNEESMFLMSDLAVSLEPREKIDGTKKAKPYAAFCLRESENTQRELRELRKLARLLFEEDGLGILILTLTAEDKRIGKMFHEALVEERVPHVSLGKEVECEELALIAAQSDFLISERLHGLVFAALGGARAIGLSQSGKIREFASCMGWPVEDGSSATAETLFEAFKKQKEEFSMEDSMKKLNELRKINARANGALIEAIRKELSL